MTVIKFTQRFSTLLVPSEKLADARKGSSSNAVALVAIVLHSPASYLFCRYSVRYHCHSRMTFSLYRVFCILFRFFRTLFSVKLNDISEKVLHATIFKVLRTQHYPLCRANSLSALLLVRAQAMPLCLCGSWWYQWSGCVRQNLPPNVESLLRAKGIATINTIELDGNNNKQALAKMLELTTIFVAKRVSKIIRKSSNFTWVADIVHDAHIFSCVD